MTNSALPIYAYSTARSALFTAEYMTFNILQSLLPGERYRASRKPKTIHEIRTQIQRLLKKDSENIANGLYPASVLAPELPIRHLLRIPRIIADGLAISSRRKHGKTTVFDKKARELLVETPKYYQRNFHFQTNGYLSGESASLYEHQVEMLFAGAADAMRRLILPPLRARFGNGDGHGLTFLELGAGTGRATKFVRQAFPRARIVAIDLSAPYLRQAERGLARLARVDFTQADATQLPYLDRAFDAVYSVFLFHELPLDARREVLAESKRVLKRGGFYGLVDSLQSGDHPPFDELLKRFPHDFHEPFYRNYASHPIENELKAAGFKSINSDWGFFSKALWAKA